jgi:hypothetical protein
MAAPQLEIVVLNAQDTLRLWGEAIDKLAMIVGPNKETFDLGIHAPGTSPPMSVSEIGDRLTATMELVIGLSRIENLLALPDEHINNVTARVGETKTHVEILRNEMDGFVSGGSVASIDSANFTAQSSDGKTMNAGSSFPQIIAPLQSALTSAHFLLLMSGQSAPSNFQSSLEHINKTRNYLTSLSPEMKGLRDELRELSRVANEEYRTLTESAKLSETRRDEIIQDKESAAEALKLASEAVTAIQGVEDTAATLKTTVDSYQEAFDKFGTELKNRNSTYIDLERGRYPFSLS